MPAKKPAESAVHQTLDLYTSLAQQVANFTEQHADVFAELARLQDQKNVAEENLKSAVRETGEPVKNAHFMVKASPSFRKWIDFPTVKASAKKAEMEVIEARAIKSIDIDAKVMQELVMEGKIRPELMQEAYKEQQLTTRVSIIAVE